MSSANCQFTPNSRNPAKKDQFYGLATCRYGTYIPFTKSHYFDYGQGFYLIQTYPLSERSNIKVTEVLYSKLESRHRVVGVAGFVTPKNRKKTLGNPVFVSVE